MKILKQHKFYTRRHNVKSKSWCLVPVTASNSEFSPSFHKSQCSFYTSSEKNNLTKIHFRQFNNISQLFKFYQNLKIRFKRRFNKKIKGRINLRGTKLEYYILESKND